MNDDGMRRALEQCLGKRRAGEPGALIRREMGIRAGRRRVDVVVIGREISGYETKSGAGSLARPDGRARDHGLVLDQTTLVIAPGTSDRQSRRSQAGRRQSAPPGRRQRRKRPGSPGPTRGPTPSPWRSCNHSCIPSRKMADG